jgi:hypothetical protein
MSERPPCAPPQSPSAASGHGAADVGSLPLTHQLPFLPLGVRQGGAQPRRPLLYYETAYDWRAEKADPSFIVIEPPIEAVFFDFDGTLTTGVITSPDMHPGAMDDDAYVGVMGGQDRLGLLREMFATLRERSVTLHVVSNGPTEAIRRVLRATQLVEFFGNSSHDGIYGRDGFRGTKDGLIDHVLLASGVAPNKALFVDDDEIAIDHVKGGRSAGTLVSPRGGMSWQEIEHILDLSVRR